MPLENIVEKIIKDAQEEAKGIISEAEKKSQQIIQKVQEKALSAKSNQIEKAKRETQEEFNREITLFNLEARKKVLKLKCDIIDDVFKSVLNEIIALDANKFKNIIKKFMPKAEFDKNSEIIVLNRDREKVRFCLSDLLGSNVIANWKIIEANNEEMKGGFYIKSGDFIYDVSLKTILEQIKSKYERDVAEILYSSEK